MDNRYRKKPVVIEAFRLGHDNMPDWFCDARSANTVTTHNEDCRLRGGPDYALIKTLEGEMRAEYGDWIIKGVKGEIYPCKPDIFEATYEPEAALSRSQDTLRCQCCGYLVTESEHQSCVRALSRSQDVARVADEATFQRLFIKHGGPIDGEGWCVNESGLRDFLRELADAPAAPAVAPSTAIANAARRLIDLRHAETTHDHEIIAAIDALEAAIMGSPSPCDCSMSEKVNKGQMELVTRLQAPSFDTSDYEVMQEAANEIKYLAAKVEQLERQTTAEPKGEQQATLTEQVITDAVKLWFPDRAYQAPFFARELLNGGKDAD